MVKVQAHTMDGTYKTFGNAQADFLANVAVTGHTVAPKVRSRLPRLEQENNQGFCDNCNMRWS